MHEANCPLCTFRTDQDQLLIAENKNCAYIQKPSEQHVLEGSGLIIPKRHAATVFELTPEEWNDTQDLLQKAKVFLEHIHKPDGYSIGWNTNEAGGQTIPHAHLHVIPRFKDEPYAGKGIRYWIKQTANQRKSSTNL